MCIRDSVNLKYVPRPIRYSDAIRPLCFEFLRHKCASGDYDCGHRTRGHLHSPRLVIDTQFPRLLDRRLQFPACTRLRLHFGFGCAKSGDGILGRGYPKSTRVAEHGDKRKRLALAQAQPPQASLSDRLGCARADITRGSFPIDKPPALIYANRA